MKSGLKIQRFGAFLLLPTIAIVSEVGEQYAHLEIMICWFGWAGGYWQTDYDTREILNPVVNVPGFFFQAQRDMLDRLESKRYELIKELLKDDELSVEIYDLGINQYLQVERARIEPPKTNA